MKAPSLLFVLTITCVSAFSQNPADTLGNIYDDLFKRNKGIITLRSGKKLEGYLDYNPHKNWLKLSDENGHELLYMPFDITGFEYFDESAGLKRTYMSCNVEFAGDDDISGTYFLEVLYEHKDVTFLNWMAPTSVERRTPDPKRTKEYRKAVRYLSVWNGAGPEYQISRDKLVTEELDIHYFLVSDTLFPYVMHRSREIEDLSGKSLTGGRKRSTVHVFDNTLPQRVMGDKYDVVKKYASKQKLDWKEKDDLVKILKYAKSLN